MNKKEKRTSTVSTFENKSAVLIGNGINRSTKSSKDIYNWEQLLKDLSEEFSDGIITNIVKKKPFPMFYEAIVNYAIDKKNVSESALKHSIKAKLTNLSASSKYEFINTIKCDEILTTNYDYLIEQQLQQFWKRSAVTKNEKFYSLSRFQQSNKRVWHIHGEQADVRSMLLGFRLYLNYTSKIKDRAGTFITSLRDNDKKKNLPFESWVDMFFTHNIHIVGLGMEFTEYTLWWLLSFRHFKKITNSEINVNNKIVLHAPSFSLTEKPHLKEMMEAYGGAVNIIDVDIIGDYDTFYEKLKTVNFQ